MSIGAQRNRKAILRFWIGLIGGLLVLFGAAVCLLDASYRERHIVSLLLLCVTGLCLTMSALFGRGHDT